MTNKFKGLLVEEHGQGMTEYGLVLGVIAVGVVGILILLRKEIVDMFNRVLGDVEDANTEMSNLP